MRPTLTLNRIIREGEAICPTCGSGRRSHAGGQRGHQMPDGWLVAWWKWMVGK